MKLLGIIILTVLVANCTAECDKGWKSFDSKCLKLFDDEKKSWQGAEDTCEESDAYLVKIESKAKNTFLLDTFLQFDKSETDNREAWTGLTDKEEEGKFVWTDGTSANFTKWADEQPNDEDGEQDCAEIANGVFWPGGPPQIGVWNDFQCDRELYYICEKEQ
ncbi:hypothetical protein OS493_028349 [Desmophyllum pertusum]|uniref:C-type lectin domain-containing protein n=1 Tax=Desmophyllum pertusum TaxID=174260 RepID=A0A9W9Y9L5_9CNID|nr:hypothetical protein OS493_028349 [Desmophyllum pertusum]